MQDEQSLDFLLNNFSGGINESVDDMLINITEAAKANNVKIENGILESPPGYQEYTFNSTCPVGVKTLMCFSNLQNNGLLVAGDGKIYHYKNNSWTLIRSGMTSDYYDYVNFEVYDSSSGTSVRHDCMIIGNGVDKTFVYREDGVWRNVLNRVAVTQESTDHIITETLLNGDNKILQTVTYAADAVNPTHTDMYNENLVNGSYRMTLAPKLKFIELHMDRVWGAGNSDDPNRVYFSTANQKSFDIDDWAAPQWPDYEVNNHGGFIDIPTWDGGKIIGLKTVFNDVVVFKNKNVFRIFGTYPKNYTKEQIYATTGAIADRSIVQGENATYFCATDGIYVYNGSSVRRISDKIKNIWKGLNHGKDGNGEYYLSKACGAWYNNKYLLAVPNGTSTTNNLLIELNTLTGAFMVHNDYLVSSFLDFQDKLLFSNGVGILVYQYDTGTDYRTLGIESYYETGTIFADTVDSKKSTDSIYLIAKGSGTLDVTCISDYSATNTVTLTLTEGYKVHKIPFRNKGRTMKLIVENGTDSTFSIKLIKFRFDNDPD